jgi:hypothetical protein
VRHAGGGRRPRAVARASELSRCRRASRGDDGRHAVGAQWVAPRGFAARRRSNALSADPRIVPLVAQVSAADSGHDRAAVSYFTRRADSATVLVEGLAGGAAVRHPGRAGEHEHVHARLRPNIIATIPGKVHPSGGGPGRALRLDQPVGLSSRRRARTTMAAARPACSRRPRSGAGAVREHDPLHWFCAEELGLLGSGAMPPLGRGGTDVVGMLQMDMIAHLEPGDAYDLDFADNDTDPALTQFCRDMTAAYVPTLPTVTGTLTPAARTTPASAARATRGLLLRGPDQVQHVPAHAQDTSAPRPTTSAWRATSRAPSWPRRPRCLAGGPVADARAAGRHHGLGGPYPLAVSATSLSGAASRASRRTCA